MKEHREPPQIVAGDHRFEGTLEDRSGRFQFRRFPFVRSQRQLKYGWALLLILAALAAFVYLGARTAFDWLSRQPQYQLPFEQIQLVPEPPPWFLGGMKEFLKAVRRDARESESLPVLKVPLEQLQGDFVNYPWVREVELVLRGQRTISVRLRYREPVAYVELFPADRRLLDEEGTILNVKDVDRFELNDLIKISGEGLTAPSDPKFGVVWKSRPKGSDHDEPDARILAAAKLAGFLSQPARRGDAKRWPALRVMDINVTSFQKHGLFLVNDDDDAIWWRETPGDELPRRPTAEQKWAMLRRWQESADHRPLPEGDYLAFSSTEVYPVCAHIDKPHKFEKRDDDEKKK